MATATHPSGQLLVALDINVRCFSSALSEASSRLAFPLASNSGIRCCCHAISMNGCCIEGAVDFRVAPVEVCEIRTLAMVPAPEWAMWQLHSAISALNADQPASSSGIIRLEVPIQQRKDAISWLHAQHVLPRFYFSGRGHRMDPIIFPTTVGARTSTQMQNLVSVAGVGSAVFFQQCNPFALDSWRCIKRFLSKHCPSIRAYGAIRFDAKTTISSEWKDFGSFYFVIPQVEFGELEDRSILAINIAWDDSLLWPWEKAVDELLETMRQVSPYFVKLKKEVPRTAILANSHVPHKASWDFAVKKALKLINRRNTDMVKVVLARSSRVVTDTDIDPVMLLACLQVEGQNAYQFCIQPHDAPAFIGNTPEQLFHRKYLSVSTEALAGTRARGESWDEDIQIERDLLCSPKDDIEFTIVRECIRRKLEIICTDVLVEPSKAIRKLPRVQHLCAQLSGRLMREDDEFDILSSLHPSPAVCGLPTNEARQFIAETEMFDRGMYAGPVGWFGGNESEFAVGIRSALLGKGIGTLIYAGAGIVEGTNPTSEWEELELKASQFSNLLQHGEPNPWQHKIDSIRTIN